MSAPIAIFSALDTELDTLVTAAEHISEEQSPAGNIRLATIDEQDVLLVGVGMGKVNIATIAGVVSERYRPRALVFTGVAGGLNPALEVGDVVVGELTIQHDAGVLENGELTPYQAGHLPFLNPTDQLGFAPDEKLLSRARAHLQEFELSDVVGRRPRLVFGTILTGDQFLNDGDARDAFFERYQADAIEMEGAALAQAAQLLGIDHLIVRSLSDMAGADSAVDFERFVKEASANSAAVIRHLLPIL